MPRPRLLSLEQREAAARWRCQEAQQPQALPSPEALPALAKELPTWLGPGTLALAQPLLLLQAWQFCDAHSASAPAPCAFALAAAAIFAVVLGRLARLRARRPEEASGALLLHCCELLAATLLALGAGPLLGAGDKRDWWRLGQLVQLALTCGHWRALAPDCPQLRLRDEALLAVASLLLLSMLGGPLLPKEATRGVIVMLFCYVLTDAVILVSSQTEGQPPRGLLAAVGFRALAAVLRSYLPPGTSLDLLAEGLFGTLVNADLTLAKMAGRGLHPGLPVLAGLLVMPCAPLALASALAYYVTAFMDLGVSLGSPLFLASKNVYCDGVFDLCHAGHKNHFRRAAQLGDRLLVGIVGDKDASQYKRPPVMSAAERAAEVAACKGVSEVIMDAPCFGLTEEFLRLHNIHVVAYGEEYQERFPDPKDDPYYSVPRKLGIAHALPRTNNISTSDIVERIRKMEDSGKKSPT